MWMIALALRLEPSFKLMPPGFERGLDSFFFFFLLLSSPPIRTVTVKLLQHLILIFNRKRENRECERRWNHGREWKEEEGRES